MVEIKTMKCEQCKNNDKNVYRDLLLQNKNKIHTTNLGYTRIFKVTGLMEYEAIKYVIDVIRDSSSIIERKGKNYYIRFDDNVICINASTFCVITIKRLR